MRLFRRQDLFAAVMLALTLVVFLMKRSVAEKGAHIGAE